MKTIRRFWILLLTPIIHSHGIHNPSPLFARNVGGSDEMFNDSNLIFNQSNPLIRYLNQLHFEHWKMNSQTEISVAEIEQILESNAIAGKTAKPLLFLNTFQGSPDFKPGTWPLILRKYSLSLYKRIRGSYEHLWLTLGGNRSISPPTDCFHLNKAATIRYICGMLDFLAFSGKSRPWTSELILHIFPPTSIRVNKVRAKFAEGLSFYSDYHRMGASLLLAGMKFLSMFFYNESREFREQKSLSSQTTFQRHILMGKLKTGTIQENLRDMEDHIGKWHRDLLSDLRTESAAVHYIAPIYYIELDKSNKETKGLLTCLSRYLCHMTRETFGLIQLWWNGVRLKVREMAEQHSLFRAIAENLLECRNHLNDNHSLRRLRNENPTVESQLAYFYAHIIQQLLRNYTYISGGLEICVNGKVEHGHEFDIGELLGQDAIYSSTFDFKVERNELLHLGVLMTGNEQNALRLIACGQRGTEVLAFDELVSVYDIYVWVLTLLGMILCGAVIGISRESRWLQLEHIFKILVEQGDPFPEKVLNSAKVRLPVAGFLLAGIVLSNGYKNTNVYRMLMPRVQLKYDFLSQLLDDKFVIYTRTALEHDFDTWDANTPAVKILERFGESLGPHYKKGSQILSEVRWYFVQDLKGTAMIR